MTKHHLRVFSGRILWTSGWEQKSFRNRNRTGSTGVDSSVGHPDRESWCLRMSALLAKKKT